MGLHVIGAQNQFGDVTECALNNNQLMYLVILAPSPPPSVEVMLQYEDSINITWTRVSEWVGQICSLSFKHVLFVLVMHLNSCVHVSQAYQPVKKLCGRLAIRLSGINNPRINSAGL